MLYLEILLRYLHFICILIISSSILAEYLLLKERLSRREIKRLNRIDNLYGLSVVILLGAGFSLWFGLGKPAEFYSKNWIFHLKIALFALVGILSIYPTLFFRKEAKGAEDEEIAIPSKLKRMVLGELVLLLFIPLCASLMAKGVGYFGG